MARIRSIKPEFPQSESMGRVSRDARLLFLQLWTLCDDSGITRGSSRILASLLYPYDKDAADLMDSWLAELDREGCIVRYVVEGSTFLQIVNWSKHQKIDKPTPSKLPRFESGSRIVESPREDRRESRVGLEGKGLEGSRGECEGTQDAFGGNGTHPKGKRKAPKARAAPKAPAAKIDPDRAMTDVNRKFATDRLENPDLDSMWESFKAHHVSKGTLSEDFDANWRTWVINAKGGYAYPRKPIEVREKSRDPDDPDGLIHGRRWQ